MRQKIGILLCIVLVLLNFTGCSASQQGYLKELDKLEEWEAYNIKLTASLDGAGQNKLLDKDDENNWSGKVEVDGYINVKDERAHLTMKLTGKLAEEIPDAEIFIDQDKIYVNKSFLTCYYAGSRFDKVDTGYIGWPATDELETLRKSAKNEKGEKKFKEIMQKVEVSIPLEKKARTYTLSINHDQAGVICKDYAKGLYAQLDELIDLYLEVNYDSVADYKEQADEFKQTIEEVFSDEEYFEMFTYFIQGALYGSHLDMKTIFTDESMTSTYKGKLQLLKQFSTNYDVTMTVQKAKRQQVIVPKSVKVLDINQYEMLKAPKYAPYYVPEEYENITRDDIKNLNNTPDEDAGVECFNMEGTYYINLDDIARDLDYTRGYDEEKKQSYLVSDEYTNYGELYALESEIRESYYSDEITEKEYDEKIDDLHGNWVAVEAENAKRFYVNTIIEGNSIYATAEELSKAGFEVLVSKEENYATVITVYAPMEGIK